MGTLHNVCDWLRKFYRSNMVVKLFSLIFTIFIQINNDQYVGVFISKTA